MPSVAPKSPPRTVILAALDSSGASQHAAAAAARFSALPGSELHFLSVVPSLASRPDQVALDDARALLEGLAKVVGTSDKTTLHVAVGKPWREIVQLAADLGADLVVVGTHARAGVERFVLGSVAEQVIRNVGCPVHVARAKFYEQNGPDIQPSCAECAATQERTRGQTLWCAQHQKRHVQGNLHYEIPESFKTGSGLIQPPTP
jgi:nucleotide-binding universal stress UspA family protein